MCVQYLEQVQQELHSGERAAEGATVVAELLPAQAFWVGERYHQQYLEHGGRNGDAQSAEKGCTDEIRCYG